MKPSVIVWDLETVPDLGGFAAANDLVGKSDVEVREAIGDKLPKHTYHSIVCIGALIAHLELDHWAVDAVGAPHVGERTEKQLIASFCDKIAELKPQLVTFNGCTPRCRSSPPRIGGDWGPNRGCTGRKARRASGAAERRPSPLRRRDKTKSH